MARSGIFVCERGRTDDHGLPGDGGASEAGEDIVDRVEGGLRRGGHRLAPALAPHVHARRLRHQGRDVVVVRRRYLHDPARRGRKAPPTLGSHGL